MPLYHELCAVHQAVFEEKFERLNWSMIASFECEITRQTTDIKLHKTTFWMSPDRDPRGSAMIVFTDPQDALLGAKLSNAAITRATGKEGDTNIILGFANNEYVARQRIGTHSRNGAIMVPSRSVDKKKKTKSARRR